jgi:hypothetical protein
MIEHAYLTLKGIALFWPWIAALGCVVLIVNAVRSAPPVGEEDPLAPARGLVLLLLFVILTALLTYGALR